MVVVIVVGVNVVVDIEDKSDDRSNKTHVTEIRILFQKSWKIYTFTLNLRALPPLAIP